MPKGVVLLTVAAALLAAAPAHAAPRTQAAADFADAALRAHVAINAQRAEHRARIRAVRFRLCMRALGAISERNEHRLERAFRVSFVAILRPLADTFLPIGRRLVADLDAVPTRDTALTAGRAAWRKGVATFERIPGLDRPCERLDEWRASGWDPAKAPPALPDVLGLFEDEDEAGTERGLTIAVRRLRQLGVSRGAAARFSGERLFDRLGDPLFGSELDR